MLMFIMSNDRTGMSTDRTLPVLGIDPGHKGGAVLLDVASGSTLACWSWHKLSRKSGPVIRLREEIGGPSLGSALVGDPIVGGHVEDLDPSDLHQAGSRIRDTVENLLGSKPKVRLAVEGLFGKGLTLERLSWYAALVSGPCLEHAMGGIYRPLASHWRPLVLGIRPGVPADAAAQAALRLAPLRVPGLGEFLLREDEHTCEAGCIAVAGSILDKRGEWPAVGAPPFTPEGGWKNSQASFVFSVFSGGRGGRGSVRSRNTGK